MSALIDLAHDVVRQAKGLGASEVAVTISEGSHANLTRRDGKVEQTTEATTRGLSVSLFVDGRSSGHGTSDLRPDALTAFLERAVAATRFLEPDPDRRQPDAALCGRGASEEALDQDDPAWFEHSPEDRAQLALELEQALASRSDPRVISSSTTCATGRSTTVRVMSNGFAGEHTSAGFSIGAECTLDEGNGRRPEGSAWFGARHLSDLPDVDSVAAETMDRVLERIGSSPAPSGRYPMILQNRVAGRILGVLGGPLSAGALYERQSCLEGRLGTAIASEHLTLRDDPLIPRGLASRPWDGDALVAKPLTIIEQGVLQNYYVGVYHGRKLGMAPTTGGRSNWIVSPGARSWQHVAQDLGGSAILVNGFLGGNANPITGDFSFGVRGLLVENGMVVRPVAEMNVSGNILELLLRLSAVCDDPWMWSSAQIPTLVFEDVDFSGT